MALKVFVRTIDEKKSVVAIVAPEGAAPERTMESLLTTLLASREENWARVTLAMLVVIAARNTGNGTQYHMVHESFPVRARSLVREAYECAKYTIVNSSRDSIILGSRNAVRKSTRALVTYADPTTSLKKRAMKRPRKQCAAQAAQAAQAAHAKRPAGSDSDSTDSDSTDSDSTDSESTDSGLCCARVRVCREPAEAEWICHECPRCKLMCAECVKVHAAWEKTRAHVPVALSTQKP
jgi:hypothetical protein